MFEKEGLPLWLQITIGVFLGNILTVIVLFTISAILARYELELIMRSFGQRPTATVPAPQQPRPVLQLTPPGPARAPAPAPPKKDGCPTGTTPGTLNGQHVCITSAGRVLTPTP